MPTLSLTRTLAMAEARPTPGFSPGSIAGLKLWLPADGVLWQDSARTVPAVADSDPVGSWDDASGLANHLLQATGTKRPTLRLAVQNGRPALRFDGVDDYLRAAAAVVAGASVTFFFAVKPTATTTTGIFDSAPATVNVFRNFTAGTWEWNPAAPQFGMGLANTNAVLMTLQTQLNPSRSVLYRKNGSLVSTPTDVSTNPMAWVTPTLGAINTTLNPYSGDMLEVLIYQSLLTAGNIAAVENYLNARWAMY